MRILVAGGAGFIGSNFIRHILSKYPNYKVVNYDKLTYAGNLESVRDLEVLPNYKFVKGDIIDKEKLTEVVRKNKITHIVNFAAESHVDRSIDEPEAVVVTNVVGTQTLLQVALENKIERFHHISTDEVFGALPLTSSKKFDLKTPYNPKSPYSASKAGSDHLVRAYFETYNLPVTISNCSNNYGPYQHPEKMISRAITNLIGGKKIPIYGDGKYVRDWIHVIDHCEGIDMVLHKGKLGETYLFGGLSEDINNLQLSQLILKIMGMSKLMLEKVKDRPGHDRRYAVDFSETTKALGWKPKYDLETGLTETINWYKENEWWWKGLKEESEKFYQKKEQKGNIFAEQKLEETSIQGLLVIKRPQFKDNRGFFKEIVRIDPLRQYFSKDFDFKQWSHAYSKPRVIRALHAENWNKIIYPVTGKMFAALVDVREDSKTFGKVETFEFDAKEYKALFIPKGVANSICVTGTEPVHYIYLVDAYYDGSDVTAIAWNDPDLKIEWPVKNPIISPRDKANPRLRELFPGKFS